MAVYVVKRGDTLSSIAARHGIASWQALYDHPSNASFRAKRPNPNLIQPGDRLNIPDGATSGEGSKATPSKAPSRPSYAMAIIDGTGPGDGKEYADSMKYSFCRQLGNALEPHLLGKYWRGPSASGSQVKDEAYTAFDYLYQIHKANPATRLMLAGYSRGGSAAIMAAELLEKKCQIPVDSLFLFDAVARHVFKGGEVIPANVQFSRHARRDLRTRLVLKYEGTFSDVEVKGVAMTNASNPMRPTFGNTGLTWRGNGDHQPAVPFAGSHGALGGVGWGFVTEDEQCQLQVAEYMNEQLKSRGVWHGLKSVRPVPKMAARPSATEWISGVTLDALLMLRHRRNLSHAGPAK